MATMAVSWIQVLFLLSYVALNVSADGCSTANLTFLANGLYFLPDWADNNTVATGDTISACCNTGFLREGPETVTCLATGEFSDDHDRPTCVDINECEAPPLPITLGDDASSLESSSSIQANNEHDEDPATIAPHPLLLIEQESCQGRDLLPPNDERCHSNAACTNIEGSFSCACRDNYIGDGVNCSVDTLECETLSAPINGLFRYISDRRLRIGCDRGYALIGCAEQICRRGRWVANIAGIHQECSEVVCRDYSVECDVLSAPQHGYIHVLGRQVGNRAYFSCEEGYDLVGPNERECLFDYYAGARWSRRTSQCKPPKTLAEIAIDITVGLIDKFTPYTNSSLMRMNMARSANIKSLGLDLVLAFDRSSSIIESDFQLALNFTKQLITSFGISYDAGGTRVAALTFGSTANISFSFSDNVNTIDKVFGKLDHLKETLGGGTALKEGLEKVALEIEPAMRTNSKHVLFIFTDGQHNTADPTALAQDLKNKGVEIYTVGVGSLINNEALESFASPSSPSQPHFFHIRTFGDLDTLTKLVASNEIDYTPCGKVGEVRSGDDLTTNDYQSLEKAWPWLSIIHRDKPDGKEMMCSGALICKEWVLTSASCFDIPSIFIQDEPLLPLDGDTFEPIKLSATLGEHNTSRQEGCEQIIEVDSMIIHSEYNYGHDFDIALLHLNESVELNNCARTTCLPSETDYVLNNCFVIGWGTAGSASGSDVPLQFPMPLQSDIQCRSVYPGSGNSGTGRFSATDKMACAGSRGNQDSRCNGDRGSPLMCQRDEETWVVHGVSTYGEGCSEYNKFGVFTKLVPEFVEWINTKTGNCMAPDDNA